jgi:hypothetical protein
MTIEFGDVVKDTVTSFQGVALARMTALHEATQIRIHPQTLSTDGVIIGSVWIEETRLVKVENSRTTGFHT